MGKLHNWAQVSKSPFLTTSRRRRTARRVNQASKDTSDVYRKKFILPPSTQCTTVHTHVLCRAGRKKETRFGVAAVCIVLRHCGSSEREERREKEFFPPSLSWTARRGATTSSDHPMEIVSPGWVLRRADDEGNASGAVLPSFVL